MADIDDLKASFEQLTQAYNSGNLDAFSAGMDDEVTVFTPLSPFPVEGRAAVKQFYQVLSANAESVTATRINSQFRVIGTTGLVWGYTAFAVKPKDGPMMNIFVRQTWTFTKSDGQWFVVAAHFSRLPSGD